MVILALFVSGIVLGFWNAYTLLLMYGWFAVPLGAPVLAFWHFYGLRSFIWLFTWTPVQGKDEGLSTEAEQIRYGGTIFGVAAAHGLCLFVAWLIHTFAGPF